MGIYLGSNALGGGGGGGAFLTDPRELSRTYVYQPRCEVKNTESGHVFIHNAIAYMFYTPRGANVRLSAVDTYTTVQDITSSNGGGILHALLFPSLYGGQIGDTITCRITMDGEEYIISTDLTIADSQGTYRPIMGNLILDGAAVTSTSADTRVQNNFGNSYRATWTSSGANYTGFTSPSGGSLAYTYVPTLASQGSMGGVKFNETLKIEFKADRIGAGGYQCDTAASFVTTF